MRTRIHGHGTLAGFGGGHGRTAARQTPGAPFGLPRAAPGRPLDAHTRAFMEARFGRSFGGVRVHTDAAAAGAARALGARAYTRGADLVFGPGQYAPRTRAGRRLLAHELAHVVQQAAPGSAAPAVQRDDDGSGRDTTLRPSYFFLASSGRLTIDSFPVDEATLTDAQRARIRSHARILQSLLGMDPHGTIEVTGHTDATGREAHNRALGRQRAAAVRDELMGAAPIPAERLQVESAAFDEPVVETRQPEPRNRRVEIHYLPGLRLPEGFGRGPGLQLPPRARPGLGVPQLRPPGEETPPTPVVPSIPRHSPCDLLPDLCRPTPPRPDITRPAPAPPERSDDGLRDFFERDPLLRLLPRWLRDRAISGLMRADEAAVRGAMGQIEGLDGETRAAITALLRALLRYMRGERWTPPTPPPWRQEMPPMTPFPRMPGERIFTLPPIRF